MACGGDGKPLPMFCVVKCTVNNPDLSSTTVISKLHRLEPFNTWTLRLWEKELTLEVHGKAITKTYRRPYIVSSGGHVITTQHKAWHDAVGTSVCRRVLVPCLFSTPHRCVVMHVCFVFASRDCHVRGACVGGMGPAPPR